MWTEEARARAQRKVDMVCTDCGDVYQVARHARGESRRCPDCQAEHAAERKRESGNGRSKGSRVEHAVDGYRLVRDPLGLWGSNTMLNRAELRDLLHLHYLAVGEMWERGGMVFEVAADERGRLEMRETR